MKLSVIERLSFYQQLNIFNDIVSFFFLTRDLNSSLSKKDAMGMRLLINNIVKGYSAPIIVYLDLKHCELEQCNGSTTFITKSCKGNKGGMGLSFHESAFDIEKMSTQVLVGLQAIGSRHLALPKQGQLGLRLSGPCAGQTREPPGAWAAPLPGADPNATWRLGLGKMPDWLWQP